ncbi:MAG: glucose 1-dehydrogenase [Bryobacteraceae bacterium]|jgi:gluconate 5-dehydrogenase
MPTERPQPRFPFSLAGETALITGGGSGLGLAIAQAFTTAGARVVLVGRREDVLRQAAGSLGPQAHWLRHDVTDGAAAAGLVGRIAEEVGEIGILVNNAGVHLKKPIAATTDEEFAAVIDTHVRGAFAMTRAVVPGMQRRRHGSILFLASMVSLIGMPMVAAYSAAKSAYLGMVRTLACELGPSEVRVNAIAPGWIESPILHQALEGDARRRDKILDRTPMARFGQPSDIGWAAVYLCSPEAGFVNGVVLPVDGGASIGF